MATGDGGGIFRAVAMVAGRAEAVNPGSDTLAGIHVAGSILLVLDSDDDCPARLGPRLLEWARGDLPIAVILAKWAFEARFLASAESLHGLSTLTRRGDEPARSTSATAKSSGC